MSAVFTFLNIVFATINLVVYFATGNDPSLFIAGMSLTAFLYSMAHWLEESEDA